MWLQRTLQILTENSCDMSARTLALVHKKLPWVTVDILSASDWTDHETSAFLLTGLSWGSEDVCINVLYRFPSMMQTRPVITFISIVIVTTQKQIEPSSGSWVLGYIRHVLTLSLIHCVTWRKELLWFFQHWFFPCIWISEIMILVSHAQFDNAVNERLTHKQATNKKQKFLNPKKA